MEDFGRTGSGDGPPDYRLRRYLSATEAAMFLNVSVGELHRMVRDERIPVTISASGQQRFDLSDLRKFHQDVRSPTELEECTVIPIQDTIQKVYRKSAVHMDEVEDDSVHLMVTSPPYFNTKMYSIEPIEGDLGDIHSIDEWFGEIGKVWREVHRVLRPGRKAFVNIMNLPVRLDNGSFRSLNLVGRTIDLCESLGFLFRRDIVWQKTNGVRAQFGTYPYPGGILINNMHEFILEFEKTCPPEARARKYAHVTPEQREGSRLDKEFWLSIKNTDVWLMAPQGSGDRRSHVAPFPEELPTRLIRAFSYMGETILDPFVGSGTALVSAARLGRNGIGYEINPSIARTAVRALRAL